MTIRFTLRRGAARVLARWWLLAGLSCVASCALPPDDDTELPADVETSGHGRVREGGQDDQISGDTLPPRVLSLTYDDGFGQNTLPIAELLHDMGIQATFFLNGCHFDTAPAPGPHGTPACDREGRTRYPESHIARLIELGHRVANHTQDHVPLSTHGGTDEGDWLPQLLRLQRTLDAYIEDDVYLLRAPGTDWHERNASALINADQRLRKLVGPFEHTIYADDWTYLDGRTRHPDGRRYTARETADRYLLSTPDRGSANGIITLHDRRDENESSREEWIRRLTLDLTAYYVPELRRRGYRFVPLDAIPGVLGTRRFRHEAGFRSTRLSDTQGWGSRLSHYGAIRLADVDADGRVELCARAAIGIHCMEISASGLGVWERWDEHFSNANGFGSDETGSTMQFGDLDGDGDDDVCVRSTQGMYCAKSLAVELGERRFAAATWWSDHLAWPYDFSDAQGWDDARSYYGSLRLVDVTGDGRADLCGRERRGITCAEGTGTRFTRRRMWLRQFGDAVSASDGGHSYLLPEYGATVQFADVTGDGLADVCVRSQLGLRCAANIPGSRSFAPSSLWTRGPFSDADGFTEEASWGSIRLLDLGGDAHADVCGRASTGVVCATGTSDASPEFPSGRFTRYQYLINERMRDVPDGWGYPQYGDTFMFADVSGDGIADVCARGAGGIECAIGSATLRDLEVRWP